MSVVGVREKLSGIFAPIVTPFDEKGEIDFGALKRNIGKMNQTPLRGYFVLGTNGEFRGSGYEEKIEVTKVVMSFRSNKVIIAGASCESTVESVELARELSSLGVDFISLLPPSFFAKRMTDDALFGYFTEVAEHIGTPVLLYNNPSVANNVCLSSSLVTRVSKRPNTPEFLESKIVLRVIMIRILPLHWARIAGFWLVQQISFFPPFPNSTNSIRSPVLSEPL